MALDQSQQRDPLHEHDHQLLLPAPGKTAPDKGKRKRVLWLVGGGFLLLFILVLLIGGLPKLFRDRHNDKDAKAEKNAKPMVEVATVQAPKDGAGLVVPGTTIPLTEAFVYARANGYLKTRLVDIGDHVRKNQLLAVIDAPDLDQMVDQARQQVRQAQQQLEQQRSQLALADVTVERYRVLVAKGVFSRQQGDQQEANYRSEVANVAAAERNVEAYQANLRRVIALQSYEYVRAPFDGVVTQRSVDVGALISAGGAASSGMASPAPQGQTSTAGGTQQAGQTNNAGSSGNTNMAASSAQSPGAGGPLFAIAQVERLRILVSVPEGYAKSIKVHGNAEVAFQEYSGTPFTGQITRTSNSVDPNTRTMLVEVQLDNHQNKLVPGMYNVVTFAPTSDGGPGPVMISGDAIAIRKDTSMVALVQNGKIHMVPIIIGRDFGTSVEVLNGVKQGDMVVTDITDEVVDGVAVDTHATKSSEDQPQAAPNQNTPVGGSSQYGDQGITDRNLQGQQSQQNQKSSGGKKSSEGKSQSNSGSKP